MLEKGIYENIIDRSTELQIQDAQQSNLVCRTMPLDAIEAPNLLAEHIAKGVRQKLEEVQDPEERVLIVNKILEDAGLADEMHIVNATDVLSEVLSNEQSILQTTANIETVRPLSGFRVSNLFTGGNSALSLGEEIRREIASSDEIYFIISFLKLSGVHILYDELKKFCSSGRKLRIITTTYCGVTQAKALEKLSELPNTEIRISYNTAIERLHAKSYIFVRHSGMNTAYIGSSNLSKSAQTEGLEWNIRVTNVENPHIIKTALATFEMYWNSPNFEDFSIGGIDKFNEELRRNRAEHNSEEYLYQRYTILPHQKQILDKLIVERNTRGNNKNLIVAATGTGKTVISAFDYQAFSRKHPRARILFIAHREEILRQALYTYRCVLQDANFGTLWVGNHTPSEATDFEHLFVSISMFNHRFDSLFSQFSSDYYDYIVIDEAHHSQANSYRNIFDHFESKLLIGLTATPERMDGKDLRPDFGGHISAEIRLPQALQAGLLTPFQYFCVSDDTDLRDDSLWNGRYYDIERLTNKLCQEHRTKLIVDAMHKYLADEYTCRALCFCVSMQHADFMAGQLKKYGFCAESITSDTPAEKRVQLQKDFQNGQLHYLCVVDIFNEGIDIPEIDTVLFLRPTESLTIFLQQLGRGLRLAPGKTELTVLDYVAQAHHKYEFANRFRALCLKKHVNIHKEIKEGFSHLPLGCSIVMEKVAKDYILQNIQNAIYDQRRIVREINSADTSITLAQFLEMNSLDIRVIYSTTLKSWTALKRAAGHISYDDDLISECLRKGMSKLIHYNTSSFLRFVERFLQGEPVHYQPEYKEFTLMLYYTLFQKTIKQLHFDSIHQALDYVFDPKYRYFKEEMTEIISYLIEHLEFETSPIGIDSIPNMEVYGCYTRADIFALVGEQTPEKNMEVTVLGVYNLPRHNATLLFVTLNKSEADFSPTTLYDDYLINEHKFHWQSQNTDSHNNPGGYRYIGQSETGNKIILFVREAKKDEIGTMPFHCFGLVDYVSSHGDRPMNITWELKKPALPQYLKIV